MPYLTLGTRTKTGTADDADPNSSAPAAADVIDLPLFDTSKGESSHGWVYYLRFLDAGGAEVADGSAHVTPWIRDALDDSWLAADRDERVGNRQGCQVIPSFQGAACFFALSDVTGTGIASVQVRVGSL